MKVFSLFICTVQNNSLHLQHQTIRNIKRSFKDYSIYFLTLVFGVAIFYTFNSIESQTIMMNLSEAEKSAFEMVNVVMSVASVFISAILAVLKSSIVTLFSIYTTLFCDSLYS